MIDTDPQLKLQAYLDAELPPGEARAVSRLLERDDEARTLFENLADTKKALAGNEWPRSVADTREFYWSRIRRRLELEDADETPVPAGTGWRWIRFLAPAGGLAALALFIALSLRTGQGLPRPVTLDVGHDIESPLEEVSTISFRSESAAMTIVWVDSHRE